MDINANVKAAMSKIYKDLIGKERKTIDEVPEENRDDVKKLLEEG
jgi:hypothetical protein